MIGRVREGADQEMSLFEELKRRNVLRMAMLYVVASWVILQVADVLFDAMELPPTWTRLILAILILGFPLALIFSWVYEMTPEGIKREKDIDRGQSITPQTGRKISILTVVLLVVAIAIVAIDRLIPESAMPVATKAVETSQSPPAPDPAQLAAEKFAPPPDRSVAVLPFANRSAREEDAYFVDGIHDDILTQLARIGSLTVISRTSVEKFRDSSQSIREIGDILGVKTVLEGGVQRAGDRVRINVQLIDVVTDAHLWAETYDRELTTSNIFAIQSEISQSIAESLKATLSPEEKAQIETAQTGNMAALEAYFLGRQAMARRTSASLAEAERQFKKAIELDPGYALAYVALADTYRLQTGYSGLPQSEYEALAGSLVEKALAINDRLGEAYISMAGFSDRDEAAREAHYQKGISLAPGYVPGRHWYGNFLARTGRPAEGLVQLEEAARLDPLSAIVRVSMGGVNERLGRFEQARDDYLAALRIDPDFAVAHSELALLAATTSHVDEAIIQIRKALALDPGNPSYRNRLAAFWEVLGAIPQADRALASIKPVEPSGWLSAWTSAFFAANRGDLSAAGAYAQIAVESVPDDEITLLILGLRDLDAGHPEIAVARYEDTFPALADKQNPLVDVTNYGHAIHFAYLLQATGETDRANLLLERALAVTETLPTQGIYGYGLHKVAIYAMQGQKERALAALRQAADQGGALLMFVFHREFASLQEAPEYQAIIAEIDARRAAQRKRVLEMEANGELAPLPD
jgi:TolB-like protein/Flp pilus assembly protein TadD